MGELILTVVLGVVATVVAVFVIQAWPSRYGWGDVVSLGKGKATGRPIYAVRFGRKLPKGHVARCLSTLLNQLRLKGPIDITFHARVVIDIGTGKEKAVPVPVEKSWRPGVSGGVLVFSYLASASWPNCDRFPPTSSGSIGKGAYHLTICLPWRAPASDSMPTAIGGTWVLASSSTART